MKRSLILAGCLAVVCGVAGCQKNHEGVSVIVEGQGRFPPSLAGRWREGKRGWEFVFERDGRISSAVIDSGMIRVTPGHRDIEVATQKLKGYYRLGPWTAQYSPEGRELSVGVVVESFHLDTGDFVLKGSSADWFVGPVSQDWQKWEAQWYSFPQVTASAEYEQDLVFEQDPNENPVGTLVFTKQPG